MVKAVTVYLGHLFCYSRDCLKGLCNVMYFIIFVSLVPRETVLNVVFALFNILSRVYSCFADYFEGVADYFQCFADYFQCFAARSRKERM